MSRPDPNGALTWRKPPKRPDYLTKEEWARVPESTTVRIIHVRIHEKGFRTQELWISTTLLDPISYPAERIAQLYRRRWDMELCFRDLKTTMGMEELRCRTPAAQIFIGRSDAGRLKIEDGSNVRIIFSRTGQSTIVQARVHSELPERVILVPRSFGLPVSEPTAVEIRPVS